MAFVAKVPVAARAGCQSSLVKARSTLMLAPAGRCRPAARMTKAGFKITLRRPDGSTADIEADEDEYILDAAETAGVELPYSCRSGTCCSCAGKVESGTLDQSDQQFLDQDQIKGGYALLCCSYPTSDLVILTDQESNVQ